MSEKYEPTLNEDHKLKKETLSEIEKYLPIGLRFNVLSPKSERVSWGAIVRKEGEDYILEVLVDEGAVNYKIAGVHTELDGKVLCIDTVSLYDPNKIEKNIIDVSPEDKSGRVNRKDFDLSSLE